MEKSSVNVETKKITEIVTKYVSGAKLESSVDIEISYSLPSKQISCFEPLLAYIETNLKSDIVNYGISLTTMEEVFLKLEIFNQFFFLKNLLIKLIFNNCRVGEQNQKRIQSSAAIEFENANNIDNNEINLEPKYKGIRLLMEQFSALIMKKLIFLYRKPLLTLLQIVLPLILLIINILMNNFGSTIEEYKNLELTLQQFHDYQPLIHYFSNENQLGVKYEEILNREFNSKRIKMKNLVNNELIEKEILNFNSFQYNYQFLISAIFNNQQTRTNITVLFNNQPFHTPAISLKYIDQTLIEHYYNITNLTLIVNNYPFPKTLDETKTNNSVHIALDLIKNSTTMQPIILALSLLVSGFAVLIVSERVIKAKHLQKICGLRMNLYWASLFLIDFIFYLIFCSLMIIILILFKVENLSTDLQPWYLFVGFSTCAFSLIPFVYVLSFMFNDSTTAFVRSYIILSLTGIIPMIIEQIISIKSNKLLYSIILIIFPIFDITKIISNLQTNYQNNKLCNTELIQKICQNLPPIINHNNETILSCCKGKSI